MDQQIEGLACGLDNFKRQQNLTKFRLAQLNILYESIKHSQCKGLAGLNATFAVSSLCTKWMQLNAGLERLDDIRIGDKTDNETQKMTTATANKFIMYSILDEFKFNDSTMPKVLNDGGDDKITRERGYIGTGFISHIENELIGLVYIVDVGRTPDPLAFFGGEPKQLTHLPEPGEMFGYVFNEKYLVRAVRVRYESGVEVKQKRQYSAWLMDIGCTVRIDIKPTLRDHYEVTDVAKTIPAYAKRFQLAQIPDRTTIYDLLHLRIQYEAIFVENGLGFVNVRRVDANPFAIDQQNEWNFYMYYFGNHQMNAFPTRNYVNKQSQPAIEKEATVAKRSQPHKEYPTDTNPFLNGTYEIECRPMKPMVITKCNPFYSDSMENLYETSQVKQKFVNFKLSKLLNIEASHDLPTKNVHHRTEHKDSQQTQRSKNVEKKILNGNAHSIHGDVIKTTVHINQSAQHVVETKTDAQRQKHDKIEKVIVNGDLQPPKRLQQQPPSPKQQRPPSPKPQPPKQQQQQSQPPVSHMDLKIINDNNDNYNNNSTKSMKHKATENEPIKLSESVKLAAEQQTCNGHDSTAEQSTGIGFPQPKNLPQVGDMIKILFQVLESIETFYATTVNDPERDMAVHEFSIMLNEAEDTQHLKAYGTAGQKFSTPKLFDKVLALYEGEYYRAQVICVIDEHTFQVFYVDYGNCEKVSTNQLFKYDSKWDQYPAYALRFRLDGIEETNPMDYEARDALEQILITDCDATINRIQYCEKTKRITYVVDLYDENGLNVAETLVQKNMAIYTEDRPKKQVKYRP